jgi:hypothetical protein
MRAMFGKTAKNMTGYLTYLRRFGAVWILATGMVLMLGTSPSMAQPRAHVYLLRGLLNVFSLGMDTLSSELNARGVYATVHNHTEWQSLADSAAAKYKAGTEGPIIIIGHSLGADAVMEMSAYLGQKGVPVALAVPFDGTQSLAASSNILHVLNITQRSYAYMRRGAGFKGTLVNFDVSSDGSIDHLNIDKSPRLHAKVIGEVLSVVGSHRMPAPGTTVPRPVPVNGPPAPAKPEVTPPAPVPAAPPKSTPSAGGTHSADGTPVIALPERSSAIAAPMHRPSSAAAGQAAN